MIDAIRSFLALLESEPGNDTHRLRTLARALDGLAHAYHDLRDGAAADGTAEPPKRASYADTLRKRYPELGIYPWVDPRATYDATQLMGDALDDVADIAADMAEAAWRWDHLGEADAAWYLHLMHGHWGRHLLNLRSYLHALIHEW
jgi:hypothetical protein